ncbi:MAG: GerMN domain-containing protein [Candidatus Coprovivens sp.]
MIKVFTFRRICIVTLLLLLAIILYSYPEEINENVVDNKTCDSINIFLIDENDYVAMTTMNTDKDFDKKINSIVNALVYGDGKLKGVLNKDVKLLSYSVDGDLLKLNFNKSFLDVSIDDEENMIESIIYSFTSLNNINKVMIFVEGERLSELPKSHRKLDLYLDRSYGINRIVDITSIVDTKMVTIYYPNNSDYYIPISYIVNDSDDKVNIIVKYAKTNRFNNSNLSSHLDYQVELMNYEATENEVFLNFNEVLLVSVYDGKLKEEVKYAISYSVFDTLGVDKVIFSINSVQIDEFRLAN